MDAFYERTQSLLGGDKLERVKAARIAIIGLGGVGSYAAEALARSGVGNLVLIDGDKVAKSNINRQLYALNSTLDRYKAEVARERIADINPNARVDAYTQFLNQENIDTFSLDTCDYIVDCIDSVSGKVSLIEFAKNNNIPIISCMGTGNKLKPEQLKVADISKTETCPLAKAVRCALRQKGITKGVKTVFSTEQPIKNDNRHIGSVCFVPSSAGLLMASAVIADIE